MLWYAGGPERITTGKPASAFSKGDLLMFNSSSSLSRLPTSTASLGAVAKGTVLGVAMASSLESIENQVPYLVLQHGTQLWSDTTTGVSAFTKGARMDVEYTGATFKITTSAITPLAIIDVNGSSADISDSNRSRVRIQIDPTYLTYRYSA